MQANNKEEKISPIIPSPDEVPRSPNETPSLPDEVPRLPDETPNLPDEEPRLYRVLKRTYARIEPIEPENAVKRNRRIISAPFSGPRFYPHVEPEITPENVARPSPGVS